MSTLFWTEGAIDAVALDAADTLVRFRLVPTSTFLVDDESENLMVFVTKESEKREAKVVQCCKNRDEKPGAWFSMETRCPKTSENTLWIREDPAGLLIEAKHARDSVRVGIEVDALEEEKGQSPGSAIVVAELMFI